MLKPHRILWTLSICLMVAGVHVSGQNYPNKPIRIVTSSAGGGSDFTTRQIAQGISGPLGQPVIVENRPTGLIPGEVVSRSPPDGYTLLLGSNSFWTVTLLRDASYDVVRDFSPITMSTRSPLILVVHPSLPVKSVKELIALAKGRPGELNAAHGGVGGSNHLAGELFNSMAGLKILWIAYKGGSLPVNALLGGEVQMMFVNPLGGMPHVKSGKFRLLAVSSTQPSALAPGAPPITASGVPGYELIAVDGVFAPAKTPEPIINRLNQEIARFLNTPEAKERFFNSGLETVGNSSEQFTAAVKSELARMGKVIKEAGIKAD